MLFTPTYHSRDGGGGLDRAQAQKRAEGFLEDAHRMDSLITDSRSCRLKGKSQRLIFISAEFFNEYKMVIDYAVTGGTLRREI